MKVDIAYEWIPPICKHSNTFGHVENKCPTKEVWIPKTKETGGIEDAGSLHGVNTVGFFELKREKLLFSNSVLPSQL